MWAIDSCVIWISLPGRRSIWQPSAQGFIRQQTKQPVASWGGCHGHVSVMSQ